MRITAIDDAAWDCPWRHRHVAEKVLLSLGLVLTALMTPAWPGSLLVILASVTLILGCARVPARILGWAALAPVAFLLMGGAAVALSVGQADATAWYSWGPLSIGPEGLRRAADLIAHGISGTLAVLVLATTTPMVDLLTWLRSLGIPDPLLEIANLTYRLLFITLSTTLLVREAQRNRMGDDPLGPGAGRRRWNNTAVLVGSVALRSWTRAERLSEGLALRGFESALVTLPLRRRFSWRFAASSVLLIAAIALLSAVIA